MILVLVRVGEWLIRRLVWVLLLAVLAVLAVGTFFYLSENVRSEQWRAQRLAELERELPALRERLSEFHEQLGELEQGILSAGESIRETAKTIQEQRERLDRLVSLWRSLSRVWSEEARIEYQREQLRLEEMERDQQRQLRMVERRERELVAVREESAEWTDTLRERETEMERLRAEQSLWFLYLRQAYDWLLPTLIVGGIMILVGPFLWKLFRYYLFAPIMELGRPILLRTEDSPAPNLSPRDVSQTLWLNPGEHLIVRPQFLQASDQSLRRRTRWLLDWSIPFTSLACRLAMMVELRHAKAEKDPTEETEEDATPGRVTVSSQIESEVELNTIDLPAGGRVILRPRFLAAIAKPQDQRINIRRHWRIFHVHAWLTLQFRYFEFEGPCRLVVWGARGVRLEEIGRWVETADTGPTPIPGSRRTNQHATIGFSPHLLFKSTRAETFWSYARGENPLFDDLFQGHGLFFCQEISRRADRGFFRRWTESFWNGFLKIFGW